MDDIQGIFTFARNQQQHSWPGGVCIARAKPDIIYREASLIFVDLPVLSDTFELLWNDYEDALDLMRPVEGSEIDTDGILLDKLNKTRHSEPEHVADITGRVLINILRQEVEHETKQND